MEVPSTEFEQAGRELWESHATWWQESFTDGADPEYVEQIIPLVLSHCKDARYVLDIGAGEGQISRAIRSGVDSIEAIYAIDPSFNQLAAARRRGGITGLVAGEAASLPFMDSAFDLVVACLVFEHIVEFEAAIDEVSRVLRPGGKFLFLLNHPLLQTPGSGWIDDQILNEQYWRIGDYLREDLTIEEVEKDVFIPFIHRPISRYLNSLLGAGLRLSEILEPAPPEGFIARAWEYKAASAIPRLLFLELTKEWGH